MSLKYNLLSIIPDKPYLKLKYFVKFKKILNLKSPVTFNEKLQWLKLHDRKPIYTTMVDKYEVKKYIANTIGKKYLIPTIGIYNGFEDIDFDKLPNNFVIKCTHDSGSTIVIKDKKASVPNQFQKAINERLKLNYYQMHREWPYKNVKPRIIIEKYMVDESKKELKDYKIFCFNGKPELIMVDTERFTNHKRNVYDTEWNKLNVNINYKSAPNLKIEKPKCLNEMLELSAKLSKGIPFIRTDFYVINNRIFFGELTFFPGAGFQKIEPEEWQQKLGKMINIKDIR